MYTIKKEFHFSASHQLLQMPAHHPCARLHGHNYVVVIELQSASLNEYGFVRDYLELKAFKEYIDNTLDHRHLNEVLGDANTTAERLAKHLFEWAKARWPEVSAIAVSETPKTWAEYRV
ncbi:MAG: 6-carboxytetrahydropterin synthase QueD [Aeromonadales bacterium]|nr:6-carboxytetrahydropterin synthase QueD [Aeromonadales bacterium]